MTIEEIAGRFATETDYARLGALRDALAALPQGDAGHPLLMAGILQRRFEWQAAGEYLADALQRFPENIDLAYEVVLNFIDAGDYSSATRLIERWQRIDVSRFSDRHLRGMWRSASMLALFELAAAAFREAERRGSALATEPVKHRLAQAQINLAAGDRACIISIGENCLPWMLPNRWGHRQNPASPAAQGVFNLAQTTTPGATSILANQAATLLADTCLGVLQAPNGTPYPRNEAHSFSFNHEQGDAWIEEGFARLKKRYAPRIDTLKAALAGPSRLFLFYTQWPGDLLLLVNTLHAVNANDAYRVLIVDVWTGIRERTEFGRQVDYLPMALPSPDYVWFQPDHYDGAAGVAFEGEISAAIARNLACLAP